MRHLFIALAWAGVLLLPSAAHANVGEAPPLGTHAVRGVVKAVTGTTLVIRRLGGRTADMIFVMSPSTDREGTLVVGAPVAIRYVLQGTTLVATAVAADSRPCTLVPH